MRTELWVVVTGVVLSGCGALSLPAAPGAGDGSVQRFDAGFDAGAPRSTADDGGSGITDGGPDPETDSGVDPRVDAGNGEADASTQSGADAGATDAGVSAPADRWRKDAGVVALGLGSYHMCALLESGEDLCWGTPIGVTAVDAGATRVLTRGARSISSGLGFACASTITGQIECWGSNYLSQLGDATTVPTNVPVNAAISGPASMVSAGLVHACALLGGGVVECWGSNASGQTGYPKTMSTTRVPHHIDGVLGVIDLASGGSGSMGLLPDGGAMVWGWDQAGVLSEVARPFRFLSAARQISLSPSGNHACAALKNGRVQCWGRATEGQLGFDAGSTDFLMGLVPGLGDALNVCSGYEFSCAVQGDGGTQCWGDNTSGQLGRGSYGGNPSRAPVVDLPAATAVFCDDKYACAVTRFDGVQCWGDNAVGQFGMANPVASTRPVHIPVP